MAIIIRGASKCSLCAAVLEQDDELVTTTAFIEDAGHRLWRHSDTGMHQRCFMEWPDREEFITIFNSHWKVHGRGMRRMLPDGTIEERDPRPDGTV